MFGSVPAAARSAAECSAAALTRTINRRKRSAPWRGGTVVGSGEIRQISSGRIGLPLVQFLRLHSFQVRR